MALTIQDILGQLTGLGGGNDNGVAQSFGANTNPLGGMTVNSQALGTQTNSLVPQATSGLGSGLGLNIGTGQLALGGLGAIASLWGGMQANKLANDQFKFTKQTTNTNLNNQIKSYNTSLEDRINSRAAVNGNDQAYVNDYLSKNRLTR